MMFSYRGRCAEGSRRQGVTCQSASLPVQQCSNAAYDSWNSRQDQSRKRGRATKVLQDKQVEGAQAREVIKKLGLTWRREIEKGVRASGRPARRGKGSGGSLLCPTKAQGQRKQQ